MESVAVECAGAFEQRGEAQAIPMLRGTGRQTGHVEQRRIEVHADDGHIGDDSRPRDAGPLDDEGHAGAAFVEHGLAATRGGVIGGGDGLLTLAH